VIAAIDAEMSAWKSDSENSTWENRGNLSRLRLPDKEKILVHRVADVLREMQLANLHDIP